MKVLASTVGVVGRLLTMHGTAHAVAKPALGQSRKSNDARGLPSAARANSRQQSIHGKLPLPADINFTVCNGWYRGLDRKSTRIGSNAIAAIEQ